MKTAPKTITCAVLTLLLFLAGCASSVQTPAPPLSRAQQVSAIVQTLLETEHIPGVAVSVSRFGHTVYSRGFGYADLEQEVPVDPARSKFRIGSVSKPITAFAVARLVEQNKLDLDAPIQTYAPGFPVKPRGEITPRLLAGHLAGIRHYRGDEFLSQQHYPDVTGGLTIFMNDPLLHAPGSKYAYSSYGYNLLSAAIESAAGEPFLEHMQRVVFDAIGLHDTTADQVSQLIPHRTRYYFHHEGQMINAPPVDNSYKWAGGGFLSTSEDLLRFANAHLNGEHLQPDSLDLLWASQKTHSGQPTGYGIGWQTRLDATGRRVVGHTGGSVGGTTVLRIYPEQELVIALIANLSSAPFGTIADDIASLYLDE